MHLFNGDTANHTWKNAANYFIENVDTLNCEETRCGLAYEITHATFTLRDPRERWLSIRKPAINPAFCIAEVFWILAGRNDASFLNFWNPALPKYAGTGLTYHGAYGHRLRNHMSFDQLYRAYQVLKASPSSRQVALEIWDGEIDLPDANGTPASNDIPCNIASLPKIVDGKLDWLQIMRSNDIFLGTPHNFVQFTTLQEILAGWLNIDIGKYSQVVNSLHCYKQDIGKLKKSNEVVALPKYSDRLSLPFNEFEKVILETTIIMDKLISDALTTKKFKTSLEKISLLPQGYGNLLSIAAGDAARRRGWQDEQHLAISRCQNNPLLILWKNWLHRQQTKQV